MERGKKKSSIEENIKLPLTVAGQFMPRKTVRMWNECRQLNISEFVYTKRQNRKKNIYLVWPFIIFFSCFYVYDICLEVFGDMIARGVCIMANLDILFFVNMFIVFRATRWIDKLVREIVSQFLSSSLCESVRS